MNSTMSLSRRQFVTSSSALAIAWSSSIRSGVQFSGFAETKLNLISSPVTAISATALWHHKSTVALPSG